MKKTAIRVAFLVAYIFAVVGVALAYPLSMRGQDWLDAHWEHPWALLLLLLAPVVLWRSTFGEDSRVARLRVGSFRPFVSGPRGARSWLRDLPGAVRTVVIMLLAVSLARPMALTRPDSAEESGIDIVLGLDLSGSMRAVMDAPTSTIPHFQPNRKHLLPTRLDVAKSVIRDFISRRKTDRIGVVVFGQSAYVLSPPTLDYQLLDSLVSRMSLNVINGNATAIGDALGVAVARLRRSTARSKAVVLFTDGDSNAGSISPQYAAHLASVVGCRVFTIQIGNGSEVKVQNGVDLFGSPVYVKARFPVNPKLLREIAEKTGGKSYVATDAVGLSKSMHDVLDSLKKTRFEASQASSEDLFPFILLPAVLLLAFEMLLRAWLLRRFP